MDSRRPLLIPNEGDEPPPPPPQPLAGVSDFRGRPVYRATSGGWRSALFVAVLEMGSSFSSYGVSANLISYLTGPLGQSNASAAAAANAWSGTARMLPLLGAFLADSFLGRYPSILLACTLYVMGLGMLTVASSLPACAAAACRPSLAQVIFAYVSLYLVAFAHGFDKPCGLAFGTEQFDPGHHKESAARSSLFNWWFFSMAVGVGVGYVQENVSWGVGVPFAVVSCASAVFLLGTPTYRLYAPPHPDPTAAMDDKDGKRSSSEEEEDARGVVRRLLPIWVACLAYGVADAQIMTLFNKQGRMLDRRIGGNDGLELPPAALQTFGPATIVLFVPIYDRAVVPALRRATGNPRGLTTLQRTGAGLATSLAAVATAAAVEGRRLGAARARRPAMSWAWLVPQYASMGVADVLAAVGMQEFFHGEMPEGRRSVGLALYCGAVGIGGLASGLASGALIAALDGVTRRDGGEGWFADDLDRGHLDYFYWLLAGVSAVALAMFLFFARSYAYRNKTQLVPSNTPANPHHA